MFPTVTFYCDGLDEYLRGKTQNIIKSLNFSNLLNIR